MDSKLSLSNVAPTSGSSPLRVFVLIVLVLSALSFLPIDPVQNRALSNRVSDSGHFPAYALLTFICCRMIGGSWKDARRRQLYLAAAICLFSLAVEVIQPLVGRSATIGDFERSALGSGFGLLGSWLWHPGERVSLWVRGVYGMALSCCLIVLTLPVIHAARAVYWQSVRFPVLADTSDPIQLYLWDSVGGAVVQQPRKTAASGVSVQTHEGQWSGAEYAVGTSSWSGYSELAIAIYNRQAESFPPSIRIDDRHRSTEFEERFNRRINLVPGENTVTIPINDIRHGPKARLLDIDNIRRLVISVPKNEPPRSFAVERIWLVP